MAFGTTLTVPTVTGSHDDFSAVIICDGTRNDLPSAAFNSANEILNGGGNLRAYTSSAKTTQLPVEIVSFVTGATPDVEVWVSLPSGNPMVTSATIFIEADSVETTQPAVTNTFGRNAVWSDFEIVLHLSSTSDTTDSTGNGFDISTVGSGATSSATALGGFASSIDFDGTSNGYLEVDKALAVNINQGAPTTISLWAELDSLPSDEVALLSARSTQNGTFGLFFDNSDIVSSDTDTWVFQPGALVTRTSGGTNSAVVSTETFLSAVNDGGTVDPTIYKDGSSLGSGVNGSFAFEGLLNFGRALNFVTTTLNGRLREFRWAKSVRAANWIDTEFENQSATTTWFSNNTWVDSNGDTNVLATTDNLIITEQAAVVNAERNVLATTASLTLSTFSASISLDLNINATSVALSLSEQAATITLPSGGTNVLATTVALSITEKAATVNAETNVNANSDSLLLTEQIAQIGLSTNIPATTDTLVIVEQAAAITLPRNITSSTDTLLLSEFSAIITATAAADITIDGAASISITTAYQSETLYYNGSNYFTID